MVALKHGASLKDVQPPSSLLRGIAPPATREDLLSHMPSRSTVDRLVNRFFESYRMTIGNQVKFPRTQSDISNKLFSLYSRANFQERGELAIKPTVYSILICLPV
jgi:hypothetical protein